MTKEELKARLDWAIDDLAQSVKYAENTDPELAARLDIVKNHLDSIVKQIEEA